MKNYFIYSSPNLLMALLRRKKKAEEAQKERRLRKIKESELKEQKREIVNLTVSYLVRRLYEIDSKLAKRLEKRIRSKELIIRVLPGKRVAGEQILKRKEGKIKITTHGYITTYYGFDRFGRQKQIGQVITLPEAKIFKKHKGGVDLARNELGTLIHELIGHATEKEKYLPKGREAAIKEKLMGELRADIMTVGMLEKLQEGRKVMASYVAGRPLEKVLIAQARKQGQLKKRAPIIGKRPPRDLAAKLGFSKRMTTKKKKAERTARLWG
jgi:hypothetical protein